MAWMDYLDSFIPKSVAQPKSFAPGSYEYFREMYGPPPVMGSPFAPPDNPAWLKGAPATVPMATNPAPNNPSDPRADANRRPEDGLSPGSLSFGDMLRQYMSGGAPTDGPGLTLRVNKPNYMPASNPPPDTGGMIPDMNTLGAINSTPYAPAAAPAAPKAGTDWGSENRLWDTLSSAGTAMMQPSWYGFGGQLSQGLQGAAQANDPMRRAQTELLRAQAGKAKGELNNVTLGRQIAEALPNNHPAKFPLMLGDIKGGAEKMGVDPNKMVNWNTETGKMEPNLLYIQAKVAESAAQGSMKWGEIGKDPAQNPIYGFPPIPNVRDILGATGLGTQPSAPAAPGQRAEAPVGRPAVPGSATGPGQPARLAPGATGQTSGEKEADTTFAKEKIEWQTTGRADVAKTTSQLKTAIEQLRSGTAATGWHYGLTPRGMSDITHPKTTAAVESIQEAAQRNLRAVLGGQFAQQEGAQLISRVVNPYLPGAVNAERATRLLTAIEQAAEAKDRMVAHFEKYGTLRDYTGPTMQQLQQQVRDAVKEAAPEKKAEAPRIDTGKKLNGKTVYLNRSTGKYETD